MVTKIIEIVYGINSWVHAKSSSLDYRLKEAYVQRDEPLERLYRIGLRAIEIAHHKSKGSYGWR